ncbi:MAG: tRNA (N6-isopentenyl adenosine(37)-C2)-methylthiotransferase MiaB [Candidatus Sulfobium sp.]|jgi:tRNA-2-methylthio-N6-dimethylallyladenosine synthase
MQRSFFVYTYGCQMNAHDSEKIRGLLTGKGYVNADSPEEADLIIFNTCAIREKAEQKFFSQLGRTGMLKRKRTELQIAVTGCVAQEAGKRLLGKAPFVDFVIGPQNIHRLAEVVSSDRRVETGQDNSDIALREFSAERESRVKAWISIMYGCNNFCSYCIVPYTRGREVSRPGSSILAEAGDLTARGYREITLLGQNVNSYRSEMGFVELLRKIDETGINRVRFVTSHPRDFSIELIDAVTNLRSVCEHIHLPIQSGSDRILELMNRGYTFSDYKRKVDALRDKIPDATITTDIIAGFPGESEEDHEDTVRALEEIGFDGIFAFKFSPKKGTRANDMKDQLDETVKSARLNRILKVQEGITYRKNKELEGTVQEILIEGLSETDSEMLVGRTRTNKIVTINALPGDAGSLMRVRIEKARLHSLSAVPVDLETFTASR